MNKTHVYANHTRFFHLISYLRSVDRESMLELLLVGCLQSTQVLLDCRMFGFHPDYINNGGCI